MSGDAQPQPRPDRMRTFLWGLADRVTGHVAFWSILTALAAMFTPAWDRAQAIWRSADDLTALRGEVATLHQALDAIRSDLARASGEDRVIRQLPGQTYVSEPVYRGDPVVLYLTVERTRLGASCRLIQSVPLFTDGSGITVSGTPRPGVRQVGAAATRLRLELAAPAGLRAGRIELHLALDYDCNGARTPDRTDPVAFNLLERAGQ